MVSSKEVQTEFALLKVQSPVSPREGRSSMSPLEGTPFYVPLWRG
jgi:hypothetical protein